MKALSSGIILEKTCPECDGTKENKWLESGKCEVCNGVGSIPTEDGLVILELVKKYN